MKSALICTVALGALLSSDSAFAWEHTKRAWTQEDMPIRYSVADDGAVNTLDACEASGGTSGCCEESVPQGHCLVASQAGFDAWHAAECADFSTEYQGICENIGKQDDYQNWITFNDPDDEIAEAGTWAVTITSALGTAFIFDGETYSHSYDSDIVFNDNVPFESGPNIRAGVCNGGASMDAVMTHEIGHLFGMDHSCEDPNKGGPAVCSDPKLRDATMYWSVGTCDDRTSSISEDDIEGFTALYGPYASFSCSHQVSEDLVVGVVPFDLNCVLVSDYLGEIVSAEWNFGDGGTSDELSATHQYTEPGNYTIQMDVHGERAACGEDGWTNTFRKVGYVRACGAPEPAFEVTHLDGLQYQMLNDSNVSVYGCISAIEWTVFKGDTTSGDPILPPLRAWEPIIEFPEPGEYTVVMNLGGIGGTTAAKVFFEAKNSRGEGYGCDSTSGAAGAGVVGAIGLLGLFGRRRRGVPVT